MKYTRSLESMSLLFPLAYGDIIELDGPNGSEDWRVDRSSAGWFLHRPGNITDHHKTIHSIDGMADFIGAILEYSRGYSK